MEFIFKDASGLNNKTLSQGDVIARTDEVIERIKQAHQYYADAPNYSHFVVLTQSCDLVRRKDEFKAPYITIAAAKPFGNTIDDFFKKQSKKLKGADFSFHSVSVAGKARQLLERHLNNTEPEFFFLPKAGNPSLPEDLVVFLRLSIALRKEHYDTLASAKIAELADVFQAKLGWLTGNIYSRVATPDIEERSASASEIKLSFYNQYIQKNASVWLSAQQAALLRKKVAENSAATGRDLTSDEVLKIIENEIPEDTEIIANNIVERMKRNGIIGADDKDLEKKIARTIANEPSFKSVVKSFNG